MLSAFLRRPRYSPVIKSRSFTRVTAKEVIKAHGKKQGVFIDVRPLVFDDAAPKDFIRIPYTEMASKYSSLPQSDPIYVIDNWGYHSEKVAKFLESKGFHSVYVVEGGFATWEWNHGPTEYQNAPNVDASKTFSWTQFQQDCLTDLEMTLDRSKIVLPGLEQRLNSPEEVKAFIEASQKSVAK